MLTIKNAAFLIIGNEVLSGRTQDSNLAYLGNWLSERGITLQEAAVVQDNKKQIIFHVNRLRNSFDYVFTSGGIGPTHDDITADTIAEAFGESIDIREDAFKILENFYGKENLTDTRVRMARIPRNAQLILNEVSAAPGFFLNNVYVMAGVPKIQRAMLGYLDKIIGKFPSIQNISVTVAAPESAISQIMEDLQKEFPTDIEVGSYPFVKEGIPGVNVVIRAIDSEYINKANNRLQEALEKKNIPFDIAS